jgi:hypothetical protein
MAKTTALLFCYALTLSVLPSRIGAQRRGTFKIGVVSPMSGANAATGANFVSGLEWWRDQVNAAGGIQTRDGYRLTAALVLEDTQGNSTRAAAKVVDFFHGLPTHVDALVNTFTAHNIAINEAMATNSIRKVLMHCSGGTPGQYGDLALGIPRWPYQFGVMVPSSTYASGIFKYISKAPERSLAFSTRPRASPIPRHRPGCTPHPNVVHLITRAQVHEPTDRLHQEHSESIHQIHMRSVCNQSKSRRSCGRQCGAVRIRR